MKLFIVLSVVFAFTSSSALARVQTGKPILGLACAGMSADSAAPVLERDSAPTGKAKKSESAI